MLNNRLSSATSRLKLDYLRLKGDPVPYVIAEPVPSNILEWHYVVRGPENSVYEAGYYHGKLVFPRDFPFRPPAIYMITPNGRFRTNTRLCLSISDFHPDTWNPAWSVSTILTGLLSFMLEKTPTMGSIESSDCTKRQLASQSLETNLKHKMFCELFPDLVKEAEDERRHRMEALKAEHSNQSGNNSTLENNPLMNPLLQNQEQSTFHSALTNLFVIIGFIIFAYIVKYVIKSISIE